MNLEVNKIKTYIGFAIKSRSIILGVDDIAKSKKTHIILYSVTLGDSSKDKLIKFANNNKVEHYEFETQVFDELFENKNIKAIAITDKNLALAIKKNVTC